MFGPWLARLKRRPHAALPRVDAMTTPAFVIDAAGLVVVANGAAARLVGDLLAGALGETRHALQAAARDGFGHDCRVTINNGDGEEECDLTVVPLGEGRALVVGRFGVFDRNLREALIESRRRFKDIVEISSDFAWETGRDGRFVFVSPHGALGWAAESLVGHDPLAFMPDDPPAASSEALSPAAGAGPFAARQPMQDAEVWFRRADGTAACLGASVRPLFDGEGNWIGARGVCRDLTAARERDAALARAHVREKLFGYIVRAMREEIEPTKMLTAATWAIARAFTAQGTEIYRVGPDGPVAAAAFGASPPLVPTGCVGASLTRPGAVAVTGEGANMLAVSLRYQGDVNGAVVIWRDAGLGPFGEDERALLVDAAEHLALAIEQVAAHERLQELSATDGLTKLLNRRAFLAEVSRRFDRATVAGAAGGALVYCDLDNFKQVNDSRGHEGGDTVLREVASILKGSTRGEDLVARLGGDEFALWLEGTDPDTAERRAQGLLERASALRPYSGDPDHPLGFSLGVALAEAGGTETLERLMARADEAMYASKRRGKGQCTIAPAPGGALRRAGGPA